MYGVDHGLHIEKPSRSAIGLSSVLPLYRSFLNLAKWLWRKDKMGIRRTFRRLAKRYFRRKVMLMYELLEKSLIRITFCL